MDIYGYIYMDIFNLNGILPLLNTIATSGETSFWSFWLAKRLACESLRLPRDGSYVESQLIRGKILMRWVTVNFTARVCQYADLITSLHQYSQPVALVLHVCNFVILACKFFGLYRRYLEYEFEATFTTLSLVISCYRIVLFNFTFYLDASLVLTVRSNYGYD